MDGRRLLVISRLAALLGAVAWLVACVPPAGRDGGVPGAKPIDGATSDADALDGGTSDAGALDGGTSDAGALDGGTRDASSLDGGAGDAGTVGAPGFGRLSGACGVLTDEIDSPAPSLFINHIDFGDDPYDHPADFGQLTPGGQEVITDGNAGGSSLFSEAFAFEVLARCEGASLLKTENEIVYLDGGGAITDLLVSVAQEKLGVSVTRGFVYPPTDPYTIELATALLTSKLNGIIESSAHVAPQDAWKKQVLHILAYGENHAAALESAWQQLPASLRADTIVVVTVTDGDDDFLY